MKKRIAIIIHGGIGGGKFSQGQPAVQQLVERMADEFTIDVFSMLSPDGAYKPSDFKLISVSEGIGFRPLRWFFIFFKIIAKHFSYGYDGFYSFWGYPSGVLAVILSTIVRRPAIIHLQGGDAVSIPEIRYGVFFNPVRAKICRWAYKRCDVLIALTDYQKSMLRKNGVARPVEVIPFGVDLRAFTFRNKNPGNNVLRFLHVANHTPVKDQKTMLETFSIVASKIPAVLTIVGGDFLGGQLRKWVIEFAIEDKVSFFDPQSHKRMPAFYDEAHILLHTSLYEGQGLVFMEAAASGTLIAGTCVGILSDMGEDCGLRVSVKEPKLLAEKIMQALQTKNYLAMTGAARMWVESKSIVQMDKLLFSKIVNVI